MLPIRTQIYLEPGQHADLIREARRLGLSLAGLIRRLVDEHFGEGKRAATVAERKEAALSLIGLGDTGEADVSSSVDEHVANAIYEDLVKERRALYRTKKRK